MPKKFDLKVELFILISLYWLLLDADQMNKIAVIDDDQEILTLLENKLNQSLNWYFTE